MAWQGQARHGEARHGVARQGVARQGLDTADRALQRAPSGAASTVNFLIGNQVKTVTVKITGKAPLLMHSDRFANPIDPMTKAHKELTSKRKKTDEDHIAIARSEYLGSCYWRKDVGFFIPGQNLDSCLVAAAKLQKLGTRFKQGVQVVEDELTLDGFAKKSPTDLWEIPDHIDCRGVKVGTAKLMRYRPIFRQWATRATIAFNDEVVNESEIKKAIADAGLMIGLGDYRPRFGRFEVEFVK